MINEVNHSADFEIKSLSFDTKKDILELKSETLQSIKNIDFLKRPKSERLKYVNINQIDSKILSERKSVDLKFTFTFDGKYNKELYLKTTAWQLLPKEVESVMSWGVKYSRDNLEWEFFSEKNTRLLIHEWTQISIKKDNYRDIDAVKSITSNNSEELNKYSWKNNDIVSWAISRWIDPTFALSVFSTLFTSFTSSNEAVVHLEDMFTQFDRERGKLQTADMSDELKLKLSKKYNPEDWQVKAEDVWVDKIKIDEYEKNDLSREWFLAKALLFWAELETKYGIPKMAVVWQALLESGDGQSDLTKIWFNAFGIKATWDQAHVIYDSWEFENGNYTMQTSKFRKFWSLEDSFEAYAKLLNTPRYRKSFAHTNDPEKFLSTIIDSWYATDPSYVSKVKSRLNHFGLSFDS